MTRWTRTLFTAFLLITSLLSTSATAQALTNEPRTTVPSTLSIMSFNIRYGTANDGPDRWEARKQLLFDTIAADNSDIAGLQEALRSQLDEIRAALPRYAEVGVGRDDGKTKGEYSAILYRSDRFTLADSGTFWFSDTPEVPGSKHWGNGITRICTWARLIDNSAASTPANNAEPPASDQRGLYIYNLHLDHQSEPSRQRAAEMLAARIMARSHPEDPIIITGDFNCGESSPAIRFLTGRSPRAVEDSAKASPAPTNWLGLTDTYRSIHPDEPESATFTAFKLDTPRAGLKIDHILITPDAFKVLDATIDRTSRDERLPSDHYPVTATLAR